MQQTQIISSRSSFIAVGPFLLGVDYAAGLTSFRTFSSVVLTALAADTASNTSVVVFLPFRLVYTETVLLTVVLESYEHSLGAVYAVEKKRSD